MIARRGSGWLAPTLLLGICLALAAVVYGQVRTERPVPIAAMGGPAAPLPALPGQLSFAMPAAETFSGILERPLFSPTRRPPAEGTVTIESSAPELEVTLVGVIISAEERIAILKPTDGARFARLSLGDSFHGWILESIEPDRVTFRKGEIEEHIELDYEVPPPVKKPQRRKRKTRQQRLDDQNQPQKQESSK